jgi:hypothetical protein
LGSIAALAHGGAESLTYYETAGWQGVMELDQGCPAPDKFPSVPGGVFPVYHLLADLAGMTGCQGRALVAGNPLEMSGMVISHQKGHTWWLANLTGRPLRVRLPSDVPTDGSARVRWLDESCLLEAVNSYRTYRDQAMERLTSASVSLKPYALARIDVENAF